MENSLNPVPDILRDAQRGSPVPWPLPASTAPSVAEPHPAARSLPAHWEAELEHVAVLGYN